MKMKVLSTLVFSIMLFASMYSEARNKRFKDLTLKTEEVGKGVVDQVTPKNSEASQNARSGEPATPGNGVNNKLLDPTLLAIRPLWGGGGRTNHTENNITASRGLLSNFTNGLKSETVTGLSNVINGVVVKGERVVEKRLKENLLDFQQKVIEGKAQLEALEVKAIAYLIAKVGGTRDVRNPPNQPPKETETIRSMLYNLAEALSWTNGRANYFGVLVHTSRNLRAGKPWPGSVSLALKEVMKIYEERAQIAKRWQIKRDCL